jgi:hypothetical protein
VAAQLFDMLARMSTSVSIAGFGLSHPPPLRRYRPDDVRSLTKWVYEDHYGGMNVSGN